MKTVHLLDCTLRDGGYLVDSNFGIDYIKGFIAQLTRAGIDEIECGFLKDIPHQSGSVIFNNTTQVLSYLPKVDGGHSTYVLLADYGRYDIAQLEPYSGQGVSVIRACFFKKDRKNVLPFCKRIIEKGYRLYVQPVDALGYADNEMLDLLRDVNALTPYAFSIVDTFGSMYIDDLRRLFFLIDHNLAPDTKMAFHSHNNLQMSFALGQEFIALGRGKRDIGIDTTMCGMGRGAGNANTELLANFLNLKYQTCYDMDILLDVADSYMENMRARCTWGYSIPYFVAGMCSSHVNNIAYLAERPGITAKDMRYILSYLDEESRKRYDYDILQKLYLARVANEMDDTMTLAAIQKALQGRHVVVMLPGKSSTTGKQSIEAYCREKDAVIIAVNFIPEDTNVDILFFSNIKRYKYWSNSDKMYQCKKILTSNVCIDEDEMTKIVNVNPLLKQGRKISDNATFMLLRLLDKIDLASIGFSGLDGYDHQGKNYSIYQMERNMSEEQSRSKNNQIAELQIEFMRTREKNYPVCCITPSQFASGFKV